MADELECYWPTFHFDIEGIKKSIDFSNFTIYGDYLAYSLCCTKAIDIDCDDAQDKTKCEAIIKLWDDIYKIKSDPANLTLLEIKYLETIFDPYLLSIAAVFLGDVDIKDVIQYDEDRQLRLVRRFLQKLGKTNVKLEKITFQKVSNSNATGQEKGKLNCRCSPGKQTVTNLGRQQAIARLDSILCKATKAPTPVDPAGDPGAPIPPQDPLSPDPTPTVRKLDLVDINGAFAPCFEKFRESTGVQEKRIVISTIYDQDINYLVSFPDLKEKIRKYHENEKPLAAQKYFPIIGTLKSKEHQDPNTISNDQITTIFGTEASEINLLLEEKCLLAYLERYKIPSMTLKAGGNINATANNSDPLDKCSFTTKSLSKQLKPPKTLNLSLNDGYNQTLSKVSIIGRGEFKVVVGTNPPVEIPPKSITIQKSYPAIRVPIEIKIPIKISAKLTKFILPLFVKGYPDPKNPEAINCPSFPAQSVDLIKRNKDKPIYLINNEKLLLTTTVYVDYIRRPLNVNKEKIYSVEPIPFLEKQGLSKIYISDPNKLAKSILNTKKIPEGMNTLQYNNFTNSYGNNDITNPSSSPIGLIKFTGTAGIKGVLSIIEDIFIKKILTGAIPENIASLFISPKRTKKSAGLAPPGTPLINVNAVDTLIRSKTGKLESLILNDGTTISLVLSCPDGYLSENDFEGGVPPLNSGVIVELNGQWIRNSTRPIFPYQTNVPYLLAEQDESFGAMAPQQLPGDPIVSKFEKLTSGTISEVNTEFCSIEDQIKYNLSHSNLFNISEIAQRGKEIFINPIKNDIFSIYNSKSNPLNNIIVNILKNTKDFPPETKDCKCCFQYEIGTVENNASDTTNPVTIPKENIEIEFEIDYGE